MNDSVVFNFFSLPLLEWWTIRSLQINFCLSCDSRQQIGFLVAALGYRSSWAQSSKMLQCDSCEKGAKSGKSARSHPDRPSGTLWSWPGLSRWNGSGSGWRSLTAATHLRRRKDNRYLEQCGCCLQVTPGCTSLSTAGSWRMECVDVLLYGNGQQFPENYWCWLLMLMPFCCR